MLMGQREQWKVEIRDVGNKGVIRESAYRLKEKREAKKYYDTGAK